MPTSALLQYNSVTGKLCGDLTHLDACCFEGGECPNAEIHLTVSGFGGNALPAETCALLNDTFILKPARFLNVGRPLHEQCVNDIQIPNCIFQACVDLDGETWIWEVALHPPELTPEHKWFVHVQLGNIRAAPDDEYISWHGPLSCGSHAFVPPCGYIDYAGDLCALTFDFDDLDLCSDQFGSCTDIAVAIHGEVNCVEIDTIDCGCHRCPETLQVTLDLVDPGTCNEAACDLLNGSWILEALPNLVDHTISGCEPPMPPLGPVLTRCQWSQRDIGLFICDDGEYDVYLCRIDAWVLVPSAVPGGRNDPFTLIVELFFQGWFNELELEGLPCDFGPDESWRLTFESPAPIATDCAGLAETIGVCLNELTFCDGAAATATVEVAP